MRKNAYAKVRLLDNKAAIKKKINTALYKRINRAAAAAQVEFLDYVKIIVKKEILWHSTYFSLVSQTRDSLKAHFGLPDPERRLDVIIDAFVGSFRIAQSNGFFGRNVNGVYRLKSSFKILFMPQRGWEELTQMDAALLYTEKGDILPWLEWLIIKGDQRDLIVGYEIEMDVFNRHASRTGLAIMVERKSGRWGGRWGVPSAYSGTERNNFLTQSVLLALDKNNKSLSYVLKNAFIQGL